MGAAANCLTGVTRSRRLLFLLGAAALALTTSHPAWAAGGGGPYLPPDLTAAAAGQPNGLFNVILEASPGHGGAQIAAAVDRAQAQAPGTGTAPGLKRRFDAVGEAAATLSGGQVKALAHSHSLKAVIPDAPTQVTERTSYSSPELWPYVSGAWFDWPRAGAGDFPPPAIASVDSGHDAT